jgi:MFS transporter, DHA2 family, multidrug resistance protein
VWVTGFSAGAVLGPPLGGLLLEFFWWGSVFLMAVPVMAGLLVLGPIVLPEYRDPQPRRFDLLSAAISLAGVLAVTYGFKQIVQDGFESLPALSIVAGLALGLAFVQRQRGLAEPLIDLGLFRMRAFSVALAGYLIVTFVQFATLLFMFQFLQLVLGLSPLEAALWAMPSFGALIVGSLLTARIVRFVRPAYAIAGGFAVAAAGYALLALAGQESSLALVVVASVVARLGEAPVFTLINDVIIGSAPPERTGAASAISETSSELGGAFGIAILGGIGAALYRSQIGNDIPADVPADAAVAARDTLGGAVAMGEQLPEPLAAELLDAAREAFIAGLQVAALTSVLLAVAAGALTAILLRRVREGEEAERAPEPGRAGLPAAAAAELE